MMQEWMLQSAPIETFFPMLQEAAIPWFREWLVWIVDPSPIEVKWPILTGFISALIVTPYQTVEYLERLTCPTRVELGATQASLALGTQS